MVVLDVTGSPSLVLVTLGGVTTVVILSNTPYQTSMTTVE